MIRAQRTEYKGISFDSKLETQWARFYDALGIAWEYEKCKIELASDLRYIPDFWLSTLGLWHETKGTIVSDQAGMLMLRKCELLAKKTEHPAILTFNTPLNAQCALFMPNGYMSTQARLGMCPVCGAFAVIFREGHDRFVLCAHPNPKLTLKTEHHYRRSIYNAALEATHV